MKKSGVTLIELLIVVAIIAILAAIAVPNFLEAQIRAKTSRSLGDLATTAAALEHYYCDYTAYPPNIVDFRHVEFLGDLSEETIDFKGLNLEIPGELIREEVLKKKSEKKGSFPGAMEFGEPGMVFGEPGMVGPAPGFPGAFKTIRREDPDKKREREEMTEAFNFTTSLNALTLRRLTTPAAYFQPLRRDPFSRSSYYNRQSFDFASQSLKTAIFRDNSFRYINFMELFPGGKNLKGRSVLYLLFSIGPDSEMSSHSTLQTSFLEYDPTNGTVSPGELLVYGPVD